VAGGGEGGIFGAVVPERLSGAVGLEAVGLDDDVVLGPMEVGFAEAVVGDVECVVGLGLGEAGLADQIQELGFPFVLGPFGLAAGGLSEDLGSSVPVGSGYDVCGRAVVVEPKAL
jgi:hypothetical protein